MRRVSREYVFKLVFEYTFYDGVNDDTLELFLTDADLTDEDREYIRECYYGVISGMDRLKAKLGSRLERFTVDRLYRPDMVVLLIALYELERGTPPRKWWSTRRWILPKSTARRSRAASSTACSPSSSAAIPRPMSRQKRTFKSSK